MFGSRKEAEEKYEALNAEFQNTLAAKEELENTVVALTEKVDTLTAQADSKLGAFKADLEEKLALAVEAGVATASIYDIVNAATVSDAAKETIKAVRSEGATVATDTDVDGADFEGDDEAAIEKRKAEVEAIVKRKLGKDK